MASETSVSHTHAPIFSIWSVPMTGKPDSIITSLTHRAMATEFAVLLSPSEAHQCDAAMDALESLDGIEAQLTIYREDSEIARINREGYRAPVEVSAATFRLIKRSLQWSERTGGAFDITAGPLVEVWGFTRRSGRKPTDEEVAAALQHVGYRDVVIDPINQTVRFNKPEMSINLGAIGKGDALDRMTQQLRDAGLQSFLIHGGQSSVVAVGDQVADSGLGWAVGISHPTKPKRRLGGVWLRNAALATSGSGKQFFHHRGRRYGHVIDPRTGYPAGDLLSLTVISESAADADAAATGFFVQGSNGLTDLQEVVSDGAAITVNAGKRQDEVEVQSIGEISWVEEMEEIGNRGIGNKGSD